MKKLVTLLSAMAVSVVLSSGPAQAQSRSFTDPVGDGEGVGRAAGMGITSYDVDYASSGLEVGINFVDLKKGAYEGIIWYVADAKKNVVQLAVLDRKGNFFVEGPDGTDCEGATAIADPVSDSASLSVPASCLGDLAKVRVLMGAEGRRGADLDWTDWSKSVRRG